MYRLNFNLDFNLKTSSLLFYEYSFFSSHIKKLYLEIHGLTWLDSSIKPSSSQVVTVE